MNARGGGRLNALLAVAITGAAIVAAVRIIPVYISGVEFEDAIRNEAKFASVNQRSPQQVQESLFRKAQQLDLPLRREAIQVYPSGIGGVRIMVRYTVPVDLIVYQHTMKFDIQADTKTAY
jgi:hypothetical protein